eukprot:tig00000789_g4146.t1
MTTCESAESIRRSLRRVGGEIRIPELVLEDVYVVSVPAQMANNLLRLLTNAAPMLELIHLKRIWSAAAEKSKSKTVRFLLCYLEQWAELKGGPVGAALGGIEPTVLGVPKYPPATPQQYQDFSAIWPCKGLKKEENLELQTSEATTAAIPDEELLRMASYMRRAAALAAAAGTGAAGVVVVDPATGEVLGEGADAPGTGGCGMAPNSAACGAPLGHAFMRAIGAVAEWNLRAFPDEAGAGAEGQVAAPLQRKRKEPDARRQSDGPDRDRPYLCTGYHVYATLEPCLMCAMACVHSRVARVAYREGNGALGALGSAYALQTIRSLNHRFDVFAGLLQDPEG